MEVVTEQHIAEAILGLVALGLVGLVFAAAVVDDPRERRKLRMAQLRTLAGMVTKLSAEEAKTLAIHAHRAGRLLRGEERRLAYLLRTLAVRRVAATHRGVLASILRKYPGHE